jgi:putative transposase
MPPTLRHRRSLRLQGYDYSQSGGYFVTLVTLGRKCIFGGIADDNVRLTKLGEIARKCWNQIPAHFPCASIEEFVVMPNHLHGILILHDDPEGTMYRAPTPAADGTVMIHRAPTIEQFGKPTVGSLPTILRSYKAAVSRFASRELKLTNIWQRNYYEHILRDQADYERIAGYILANPTNWYNDDENPTK